MILGGLVAIFIVIVQSCQKPKTGLETFASGTLARLEVQDAPPLQPDLTFQTVSGESLNLRDERGKVILLNVWATWCPPCVKEMPMLDALERQKGGEDFKVITVSLDRQPQEPVDFFERQKITTLTPWHDGTYALSARVKAPGLPISIFYSRDGRELARIAGDVDWTRPEVIELVDYLIAQ